MNRTDELRKRCLKRKKTNDGHQRKLHMIALTNAIEKCQHKWDPYYRNGFIVKEILSTMEFDLDELELLTGRFKPWDHSREDEFNQAIEKLKLCPYPVGQTGHTEIDYPLILEYGIVGIRKIIEDKIAKLSRYNYNDMCKLEFYQSTLLALDGFKQLAKNIQNLVKTKLNETTDPKRKEELKRLLEVVTQVPIHPARDFYEAIQSILLTSLAVMFGERISYIVPGRLDRSLIKYYNQDIQNGSITPDFARQLIECMYIIYNENIHDGGAVSVMVAGQDENGNDTTNELSYLCLQALRNTRLSYPTVGICWNENTPKDLSLLACDLIKNGIVNPAFFGDDVIIKGLKYYGVSDKEAHHYINSTCVEITPIGSSNIYVASPYFNLPQTLLDLIYDKSTTDNIFTFDEFLSAYKFKLADKIAEEVRYQNQYRLSRLHFGLKPLQSVFTKDCIDKGIDIDEGGARYNWIECSFVGLANLVDSFYVIRKEIFEDKLITFDDLRNILDKDYEGFESIRQRFLNYPKYGNAIEDVDKLAFDLTEYMRDECAKYTIYPGDKFIPGLFCWQMHERLGRQTPATPDGRKKGFPFADGAGPAQGRELKGPTSAILSTTSWPHWAMIGGLVLNLKFSKSVFKTQEDIDKLYALIESFLKLGGFEVQINVVDTDILRCAQRTPDQYEDLIVRIAGYTDYFTKLSPEMQEEIITRYEHNL